MSILETQYIGTGSDKQVAWAKSIFDAEMQELKQELETIKLRVADGSLTQIFLDTFLSEINKESAVSHIKKYAQMRASDIIDYKGYNVNGRKVSFRSAIMSKLQKLAKEI